MSMPPRGHPQHPEMLKPFSYTGHTTTSSYQAPKPFKPTIEIVDTPSSGPGPTVLARVDRLGTEIMDIQWDHQNGWQISTDSNTTRCYLSDGAQGWELLTNWGAIPLGDATEALRKKVEALGGSFTPTAPAVGIRSDSAPPNTPKKPSRLARLLNRNK